MKASVRSEGQEPIRNTTAVSVSPVLSGLLGALNSWKRSMDEF